MEKRFLGGILLFVGFLISVVTITTLFLDYRYYMDEGDTDYAESRLMYAMIQSVVALVIIVGAASSISGRSWTLSLVGAIVCLLSAGILMLGSLCGLIALVLITLSKDEFEGLVYIDPYGDNYYEEAPGAYAAGPQQGIEYVDQYGRTTYEEDQRGYR